MLEVVSSNVQFVFVDEVNTKLRFQSFCICTRFQIQSIQTIPRALQTTEVHVHTMNFCSL